MVVVVLPDPFRGMGAWRNSTERRPNSRSNETTRYSALVLWNSRVNFISIATRLIQISVILSYVTWFKLKTPKAFTSPGTIALYINVCLSVMTDVLHYALYQGDSKKPITPIFFLQGLFLEWSWLECSLSLTLQNYHGRSF